jgi:hypothetical protein
MNKDRIKKDNVRLKIGRIMRLTTILILTGVVYASASSYALEHRVSVEVTNGTFYDVVTQMEKQSEFMFFYKSEEIEFRKQNPLIEVAPGVFRKEKVELPGGATWSDAMMYAPYPASDVMLNPNLKR